MLRVAPCRRAAADPRHMPQGCPARLSPLLGGSCVDLRGAPLGGAFILLNLIGIERAEGEGRFLGQSVRFLGESYLS